MTRRDEELPGVAALLKEGDDVSAT